MLRLEVGTRLAKPKVALRTIQFTAEQLSRKAFPNLRRFARNEQISQNEAAVRLLKLACFHRASEIFLRRRVQPSSLIGQVLRRVKVDKDLCAWLAQNGPRDGPKWAAFAYSMLLSPAERRTRGQFFTPPHIAAFMTKWAVRSADDRILDPGTGPGIFLASAYARLLTVGASDPVSQLAGVELSPVAPTFAALALAARSQRKPKIHVGDFLTNFRAPRRRYDVVVGNPPYSRHHVLSTEYKRRIGAAVDTLLGEHMSLRAGIYVHFLVRSLALLRDGGRLAFLIPREFFDTQYGAPLRRYLLRTTKLRGLIVFDPSNGSTFADALTTSVIIVLERGTPDGAPVRMVHVSKRVSEDQLLQAVRAGTPSASFSWGWSIDIPVSQLARAQRWSTVLPPQHHRKDALEVPLRRLVQIRRGIATGANQFFVMSDRTARAAGLPGKYLRRVIARTKLVQQSHINGTDFIRWKRRGERIWLLDAPRGAHSKAITRYLRNGRKAGIHNRYLCRNRKVWHKMEQRPIPPIIVTYMSRGAPRFIRNDAGVVPLNVFHAIYPKEITPQQLMRLLRYLNSEGCHEKLKRLTRTYGSGLQKIEPGDLLDLRVPDPRRST